MNPVLRLWLWLCLGVSALPAAANAQPSIRVGEIASERDCRLYETFWGGWLILECRNNFAELRTRLQSALAETRRFTLSAGSGARYVVSGTITELGVTSSSASGRDYQLATTRAVASFDVRLREVASGRVVYAGTITRSIEAGASLSADGLRTGSGSSPRAVYAALQREVSIAAAQAIAFQVDPLRVTAASGRQIRLNYGAPLLAVDATVQVTDASGFPVRYRVTGTMPDGAIAETAAQAGEVQVGAPATVIDGGDPAAGMNRFARVELPSAEDVALGGSAAPALPPPILARPAAAPGLSAGPAMRSRPGGGPARPRIARARSEEAAAEPAAASAGARVALVIGVSTYGTLGNLTNPTNDARALADALRTIGFDVDLVVDPDQRTMKRAISRLGERMGRAGRGATGLFYFAGHGVQSRGVNFLIPAQAAIAREGDLELEAVSADTVLRQMEEAADTTNIIILDACRNLPPSLRRSFRSGTSGLAMMQAPSGSFIAFSTAPGDVAADGEGANSPFAGALLQQIARPGQPIEEVFRNVRRSVLQATGGNQTPWDSSSLTAPFFFRAQ